MTTQFAILKGLPAGLTFTSAKLFAVSAPDTVVTGNTFSFSNRTNATSQYVVSIVRSPTALPAGDYTLIAYIGTAPRAELNCTFTGTDSETATDTPGVAELNTETLTQLDDIETAVNANTGYLTALTSALSALATKIRKYFQLSLRKDAAIATDNAAELTELNASGGSGTGSYLSTSHSQQASRDSISGAINSVIASAGVTTTVTGIPTFLRVGDARTVANGGAIAVRLYDADDDSLLFGLGTQLFEDATITFSLRRSGNDGTEGAEEAVIPCTWVASGGDGYVQIAYEADALDDCDAMDKLKEKDCHRWGIKFQWGSDDPITPVYGTVFVLRKIVSTQ